MRIASLLLLCGMAFSQDVEYNGHIGYWLDVVATAYSPQDPIDSDYHASKGDKWRWITADGRTNVKHIPYGIAVPLARKNGKKLNKPWMSFGTKIIIPTGYGYLDRCRSEERIFKVDDVGNGKEYFPTKNGKLHIDLRFIGHSDAIAWAGPLGYREIKVFVVTGIAPPPVPQPIEEPIFLALNNQVQQPFKPVTYYHPKPIQNSTRYDELIILMIFIPLYALLLIWATVLIRKHEKPIVFRLRIAILWMRKYKCALRMNLKKCVNLSLATNSI